LESGIEISCSYTTQNDEAVEAIYRIGLEADAPIFLAYGAIRKSPCRTAGIHPNVVGKFAGWITIDGEELALVDSLFRIPVDNELGDPVPDLKPGDWVECTGELTLRRGENESQQAAAPNRPAAPILKSAFPLRGSEG